MPREEEQANEDEQVRSGPLGNDGPLNAKQILELGRRPRPSLVSQARREEPAGNQRVAEREQEAQDPRAVGPAPPSRERAPLRQTPLNVIPEHSYTLLVAESGHGKTWFALDLARMMATKPTEREEPLLWLGMYHVEPRKVLYLDEENGGPILGERLGRMGMMDSADLIVWPRSHLKVDSPKDVKAIIGYCRQEGCCVVFLDSLVRFHQKDENESQAMAAVSEGVRDLVAAGLTVIALHHTRKAYGRREEMMRGSSEIMAGADTVLYLENSSADGDMFTLSANKLRYASKREFRQHHVRRKEEGGRVSFIYAGDADKRGPKKAASPSAAVSPDAAAPAQSSSYSFVLPPPGTASVRKKRGAPMADHVLQQVTRLRDDQLRAGQPEGVRPRDIQGNNAKKCEAFRHLIAGGRLYLAVDKLLYLSPQGTDAPAAEPTS